MRCGATRRRRGRSSGRCAASRIDGGRAARQVPDRAARRRRAARDAPADDGQPALGARAGRAACGRTRGSCSSSTTAASWRSSMCGASARGGCSPIGTSWTTTSTSDSGPSRSTTTSRPTLLAREAAGRKAPVKAFLLDQRRIAGVGNIYADEALFRARIHPLRPAGRLRRPDIERLRDGIVAALELGIASQGASIDDYRHYNGDSGGMQDEFLVHLREDRPCPNCGRPIVKLRVAGRGTYICRRCQPAPRRLGSRGVTESLPPGFSAGHWSDREAATGCTVVLPPAEGATASVDIRGGGTGSRETQLLDPLANPQRVHARAADRRQRLWPGRRRRRRALAGAQGQGAPDPGRPGAAGPGRGALRPRQRRPGRASDRRARRGGLRGRDAGARARQRRRRHRRGGRQDARPRGLDQGRRRHRAAAASERRGDGRARGRQRGRRRDRRGRRRCWPGRGATASSCG